MKNGEQARPDERGEEERTSRPVTHLDHFPFALFDRPWCPRRLDMLHGGTDESRCPRIDFGSELRHHAECPLVQRLT